MCIFKSKVIIKFCDQYHPAQIHNYWYVNNANYQPLTIAVIILKKIPSVEIVKYFLPGVLSRRDDRHFSSNQVRRLVGCRSQEDNFFCPTCRHGKGSHYVPGKFHNMTKVSLACLDSPRFLTLSLWRGHQSHTPTTPGRSDRSKRPSNHRI